MAELKIGRQADCDIVINDPTVSRRHAILIIEKNQYAIKDEQSVNGTFVNGNRISGYQVLKENDIVKIGNTVLPWKNYIKKEKVSEKKDDGNKKSLPDVIKKKKPISTILIVSVTIFILLASLVIYFFYISQKDELRISATWVCDKNCGNLTHLIFGDATDKRGGYTYVTQNVMTDSLTGTYYINTSAKLLTLSPGPTPSAGFLPGITRTEVTYKYEMSKNVLSLTYWNNGVKEGEPIKLAKMR
jgi:hypothetical protein